MLLLVTLALVAFGLVMVYSATSAPAALGGGDPTGYLARQGDLRADRPLPARGRRAHRLPHLAKARAAASSSSRSRSASPCSRSGDPVNGARRWLAFGPAVFQPSELAKLALAVWASAYLARRRAPQTLAELAKPLGLVAGVFCAADPARARPRHGDLASW